MTIRRGLAAALAALATGSTPAAAQSGSFGNSVVVTDGEIIVGEPTNYFGPGAVYVYRKADGAWREVARLHAPDAERADGFGTVLTRTANTLIVGQRAGPLHTFVWDGNTWSHAGTIPGTETIGIQPDPSVTSEWGRISEIPLGCNQYGYCSTDFRIAVAADGEWLLVGDARGSVVVGSGHADPIPGRTAGGGGAVHVFRREAGGGWTREGLLQPADGMADDLFGASLAVSGGRALIGAPNRTVADGEATLERAGRVYEFRLDGGGWQEVGAIDSRPEAGATFGSSVAIEGGRAVIGAPGSSDGHGAAYLYELDPASGVWAERLRLSAFSGISGDRFGAAVAIDGSDVWVGAPVERGNESGRAYVYRGDPAEWLLQPPRAIALTDTDARDGFGGRLTAADGIAAVTATGMDHGAGTVHLWERDSSGAWQEGPKLAGPADGITPFVGERRECTDGRIGPFDCEDVELLSFVPGSLLKAPGESRGVRTNDVWGWTDDETGREYALVGRNDGTSFIDVTDPENPVLIGDLSKTPDTPPSHLWRDIKTYGHYAYVVADGAGDHGMQVFDLYRLRQVTDPPAVFEPDVLYRGEGGNRVGSSHNVAINQETGFAYLIGGGCDGVHMVDIREPLNPRFAGCMDSGGTHDLECLVYHGPDERYHGHEICLRSGSNSLIVSDVTDRDNPTQLARVSHPNPGYMHQGWTTSDHRYHFMDDENDLNLGLVETTRTLVWDLTDLEDPSLALEFMGSMTASAHNLYIQNDTMYQANYRYGLQVIDVSDPLAPKEIGHFDTSPYLSGPGFSAAWSNYPFFKSGTVLVTSVQEGLFLLKPRESEVVF